MSARVQVLVCVWVGLLSLAVASEAGAQRTSCCSFKFITRSSPDPNDLISNPAPNLPFELERDGQVTQLVSGSDSIVRQDVTPGTYVVRVPSEGLVDEFGTPYKVAFVGVAPTSTGVLTKCLPKVRPPDPGAEPPDPGDPTGREGNVVLVARTTDFNPSSQSDYEIGLRFVPLSSDVAVEGGVQCTAPTPPSGNSKKKLTVEDLVGIWLGGFKNKKLGTSGDVTVNVTSPDADTVNADYDVIGSIFGCADSPSGTLAVTRNADFTDDTVDFTRSSETFGDVHVVRNDKRKVMASSPATCGGLGPAFEAVGKINKKEKKGTLKFKLTFLDGQKIKSLATVGKQ